MPPLIPKAVIPKKNIKKEVKQKKEFVEKTTSNTIDPETADHFAQYVKGLDRNIHINPLVKRITYKDGKTRIGVVYEFIQLWNEFVSKELN